MKTIKIKCVVVGDGGVGKTSLIYTLCYNEFPGNVGMVPPDYEVTMNVNGQSVRFKPFDTAGYNEYDDTRPRSYRKTDVFIVCFSLTDETSLESVRTKWKPEIQRYCPHVPIVLVGTKLDLCDEQTPETDSLARNVKGTAMAKEISAVQYMECSALTKKKLRDVFQVALKTGIVTLRNRRTTHGRCSIL